MHQLARKCIFVEHLFPEDIEQKSIWTENKGKICPLLSKDLIPFSFNFRSYVLQPTWHSPYLGGVQLCPAWALSWVWV